MTAAAEDVGAKAPTVSAGRGALPMRPAVESSGLDAYLDTVDADAETRAFCHELADTGVGIIDLGEEGRALCDEVVAVTEPLLSGGGFRRIQDGWLRAKAVQRLAALPKITDLLTTAYGRRAFPFQTLNFRRGTEQAAHSDAIHFHSAPERFMCGVWIALEDISANAGPLEYVVGSHKLPVLTMQGAGVESATPTYQDYLDTYLPALHQRLDAAGLPKATAVLRKGQALVWAANLAHGGSPVRDPESTRRSLVVHFYFEDCLYYTPMTSSPEQGRYSARLPMNVRTGGWVWPRRNGRRVPVGRGQFADACIRRFLRRPNTDAPISRIARLLPFRLSRQG